ncbi:unnamed protein product [Lampetra planeri]
MRAISSRINDNPGTEQRKTHGHEREERKKDHPLPRDPSVAREPGISSSGAISLKNGRREPLQIRNSTDQPVTRLDQHSPAGACWLHSMAWRDGLPHFKLLEMRWNAWPPAVAEPDTLESGDTELWTFSDSRHNAVKSSLQG